MPIFVQQIMNMNRLKTTTAFLKNLVAGLLAVVFFSVYCPAAAALPQADAQNYIVKLKSSDAGILWRLGSNIIPEFGFSSEPEFQNIFKFTSGFGLNFLKSQISPAAVYIEPDGFVSESLVLANSDLINAPSQAVTANDPGFTPNPLNIDKQWALPKAGFDYAWSKTTGSNNNVVAIIDTGLDATHEDLQNLNLVAGYNFLTNQDIVGKVNSDDNGHGTLVAGILGATANNGLGIAGANWVISIMPVKVLDASGKGESASVAQAIVWAADHGANFINLSLGGIGFGHDTVLINAVTYAFKKGVLLVAAAGNDSATSGSNLDIDPVYPVCDDGGSNMIIGVAALDQNDLKAGFSNFGKNCIDVSAPGKRILSTINYDPLNKAYAPNSYAYVSGTSIAVPFVVAQAALIKALNPGATNSQIRDQILATADPIDNLNLSQCNNGSCRGLLGAGRINVRASVDRKIPLFSPQEGDLVTTGQGQPVFQIIGGQKRQVSPFVLNQKFLSQTVKTIDPALLANFLQGPFVTPQEGTLLKTEDSPAVYFISNGQKLPVTYQVFLQRKFDFSQVVALDSSQVSSWITGNLLAPAEGSLVKTAKNFTVYWVVGGTLHPINRNFYVERALNIFPILSVSQEDLDGFPKGEAYIR